MSLTVRTATAADVAVIAEYNRRLAAETEGLALEAATIAAGVAAAVGDPERRGPYLLACTGGEVVGQLQITFEWSDWRNGWFWWVQSVYVRADARKGGVFRALMDAVAGRANAAGDVIGIRLYVERDNAAAQATYQRLGFHTTHYYLLERAPV
jgi:ribosomal protein S18 acetylase RimI-like enzyme